MPRRIESHQIAGPAGDLEGLLEEPENRAPTSVCVVCHPHPLYGGTMLNKVVYRLARGVRHAGAVAVRFNFRGVGRSQGKHDQGIGEIEDARAVLAFARARYPALPYSLAGFSFGSRVALQLACRLGDAQRVIAVGYPALRGELPGMESCTLRKIFIQSTNDVHGPRAELETFFATLSEPKELHWIEAADHFFEGALEQLEQVVQGLG